MTTITSCASAPDVHPGWRWRERECSWFAATLAFASVLFSVWPELDLRIAGWFYQPAGDFAGEHWGWVLLIYESVPWLGRAVALIALVISLVWWRGPGCLGVRWWRRWQVLGLSLLLGLLLLVHGVAKENWGRARPHAVAEFGGSATFTPALRPARECRTNCSFVSGHAGTGFMLAAVGLLGSAATRRRWLLIGALAGSVIGLARIAQGGHFASDVLFSGLMIWGCNLALRAAWLRVRLWRLRRARGLVAGR